MAAPVVTASLDKATYKPGEKPLLTISYGDADTKALKVTIAVTDSSGNVSAPVTVNAVIDPLILTVTDASGRPWTKVSDNGAVAVYTTTV
jgi:hypothetical protein